VAHFAAKPDVPRFARDGDHLTTANACKSFFENFEKFDELGFSALSQSIENGLRPGIDMAVSLFDMSSFRAEKKQGIGILHRVVVAISAIDEANGQGAVRDRPCVAADDLVMRNIVPSLSYAAGPLVER